MKSVGGLWSRLLELDTYIEAFHRAAKGKSATNEVRAFRDRLHAHAGALRDALVAGTYRFGPYRSFMVYDPKPRWIQVAPFDQRVAHHALMLVTGEALERSLIDDSYACRKGKGQHAAARRAHEFARRFDWYLKLDVRHFYARIEHDRLLALLDCRFRESALLRLFENLVRSYDAEPGRGLPIGNLTSQYLGNAYLDALDHWFREARRMRGYVRYMDDILVFDDAREPLRVLRDEAAEWLEHERGLDFKHGGELHRVVDGVPFVGFTIRPDRVNLHPRSARRYGRKLGSLKRAYRKGHVSDVDLQRRGQSLVAATQLAACRGFRNGVERRQKALEGYT